jgi:hypothetical protein
MSGRPFLCRGILVVALAALLGHICAPEIEGAHGPAGHARSTGATHSDSQKDAPDVHGASCDGIKPTTMGPLVSTVESRPIAPIDLGQTWSRPSLGTSFLEVSRPALFILHASLLI